MTFANTLMLAGLGGAVVPLVIHLLGRARYRSLEWGAMMFIDAASPRFREPGRLREWTLLGIRMAAVALLAIALARPVMESVSGASAGTGGEPRVAAAIVVDCSASMGYADVAGPRIEQARRAVLDILTTMKRGDRVALFASAPAAPPGQLNGDLQAVASRANDLKPIEGITDLAATIESAVDLLGRQERVSRQLFVISDRQASNWQGVNDEFIDRWRAHAPLARFIIVPVGGNETDNLVVESITVVNLPAVARCPGEVQVRVRNHGTESRGGVPMTIRLNTREVFTTTLNIPANDAVTATAMIPFAGAGLQRLSAEIRGGTGGSNLDDRREVIVDVASPLRTLLVRSRRLDEGAGDVVRAGLATIAAVDEVSAGEWDASVLAGYRAVVLDDVASLDPKQIAALEQFVYGGGGLIIAPGPASRTSEYNRLMYREEGGLLPALLQPPVAPPEPVAIDRGSVEASHAMTHFLAGQGGSLTAAFGRYVAITARTPEARVIANFTNGDAFLVESPFGRGRVVLVTSSLRPEWSTLPLVPLYVPLMQSALRYVSGANVRDRNVSAGEEIVGRFEPAVDTLTATVVRPDGSRDTCEIVTGDGRSEARYGATTLAGVYTIRANAATPPALFGVMPPPRESDLTPIDDAAWNRLRDQFGFTRIEPGGAAGRTLAARLIGTRGARAGVPAADRYWLAALAGVLALFVVELALTRFWTPTVEEGAPIT